MKVNVKELTINPINPRKIRTKSKLQLTHSVLLFSKMLDVRDIVINKDNIVLAGNQRVTVLKELSTISEKNLEKILASSRTFSQMEKSKRRALINQWMKWQENPEVEVTCGDFTEEEEREFLIKDNQEYGEFDTEVLGRAYDKEELIEYGVDDDITSLIGEVESMDYSDQDMPDFSNSEADAEEDDENDGTMDMEDYAPAEVLKIGKFRVPLTEMEYNRLYSAWMEFVESHGKNELFIQYLLDNKNKDD